jgi:hypothetical protein
MPPINVAEAGGGVQSWYQALPPITRFMATSCFLVSLGCYVGLLHPFQLALLGPQVFKGFQVRVCVGGPGVFCRQCVAQPHTPPPYTHPPAHMRCRCGGSSRPTSSWAASA